jgi:hypothetical protein
MNYRPVGSDFSTTKITVSNEDFANFVFQGKLPDNKGNLLQIQFVKLTVCADGTQKDIWVLCTQPFDIEE